MAEQPQKKDYRQKSEPPRLPEGVLAPVAAQMKFDLLVGDGDGGDGGDGDVVILHDRPFPGALDWIEYDEDTNRLVFVFRNGDIQDLGLSIPPFAAQAILRTDRALLIYMKDGSRKDLEILPLMARESVFG